MMKYLPRVLIAVSWMWLSTSYAQEASLALGQKIAQQGTASGVSACMSCHGAKGEGSGAFPRIGGTGQIYLKAQLDAFASGARKSPIMEPLAQKLSAEERSSLAAYYGSLPAPFTAADKPTDSSGDAGALLAQQGKWSAQLPACAECHGPGGSGVGSQFPPLAGLPAGYIVEQLKAWRIGARPPGPLELMMIVATKLTDGEIDAVSHYYEGLRPVAASQTGSETKSQKPGKQEAPR